MKQLILAGLCLSLGACMMVGPDYEVPQDGAVQRSDLNGPLRQDADSVVSAPVPEDWWQLYQDQRLNELVRQALSANTELRVAAANIAKARAQVEVAESQGGFNGGVKLGAQRLQESGEAFLLPEKVPVANIGEAIISASYQFDLWALSSGVPRLPRPTPTQCRPLPTLPASPWWRMWSRLTPKCARPTRNTTSPASRSICRSRA